MTRIIIDDVDNPQDLYEALAVVATTFADPARFESEEEYFSKRQPALKVVTSPAAGPKPFIPCPRRGTHLRLTECWLCWSDVGRGACTEAEALAPDAWDRAFAELLTGDLGAPPAIEPPASDRDDEGGV